MKFASKVLQTLYFPKGPDQSTQAVFLVLHGIAVSSQQDDLIKDHLVTLAQILKVSSAS